MDARKINLIGGDDKAIILSFQFTTAKSAKLVALDATKCDRFNRSINSNQRSSFHPSPVITAAR